MDLQKPSVRVVIEEVNKIEVWIKENSGDYARVSLEKLAEGYEVLGAPMTADMLRTAAITLSLLAKSYNGYRREHAGEAVDSERKT